MIDLIGYEEVMDNESGVIRLEEKEAHTFTGPKELSDWLLNQSHRFDKIEIYIN